MNIKQCGGTATNKVLAVFLSLICLAPGVSCATRSEPSKPAEYGDYGEQFAVRLATTYPYRSPYSEQEQGAAELIEEEFKSLGYTPERQVFSPAEGSEYSGRSSNIIVTVPGSGFYLEETEAGVADTERVRKVVKRQVIIGARYDVPISSEQQDEFPNYNGISDNASGVAALLTLAKEMRSQRFGYDVVLIAFGAGNDDQAGATHYAAQMTGEDSGSTDAVYVLGPIFAGDKLYAHAGRNSLKEGKKFAMRRKLFQMVDVVFEHELKSKNNEDLLLNEAMYKVEYPAESGDYYLYREFTLRDSDYVPFDRMEIPCVYLDSGNYDVQAADEVKESTHPAFEAVGGRISGTDFDSTDQLKETLAWGMLKRRINNTAFILFEAVAKGMPELTPVEQGPVASIEAEATTVANASASSETDVPSRTAAAATEETE